MRRLNSWLLNGRLALCSGVLLLAGASLGFADEKGNPIKDSNWKIAVRPYNYDPLDEGAYLRASQAAAPAQATVAPEPAPAPESVAKETSPAPATASSAANSEGPRLLIDPRGMGTRYSETYRAIPFSRTEYEANPAYRQETAMELMFGTMRPMTVYKNVTPHYQQYPDFYPFPFPQYPGYGRFGGYGYPTTNYGLPNAGMYHGYYGY